MVKGEVHNFSRGSIPRNIMSLALPMTAAQLINVLYSVVDRVYLGRLPGHLALTGLGLTIPIVSIIMGFANLCGTGGAPLCSIKRGQGDNEEAERVLGNAFTLLLIFGAAVTAVFLWFKQPLLYLFGASDATYSYAEAYFTLYLLGTPFALLASGLRLSGEGAVMARAEEPDEAEEKQLSEVEKILSETDINSLSPMQAFLLVSDLVDKVKNNG